MGRNSGRVAGRLLTGLALSVVLVVASVATGGCASGGSAGLSRDSPAADKQVAVAKRAEERWQAVIRGDFVGAYGYFSSASREVISATGFAARMSAIPYRAVKADKVECDAEVCTVSLTLTYDNPPMKMTNVKTPLQENWIIERGQAWFVFRG